MVALLGTRVDPAMTTTSRLPFAATEPLESSARAGMGTKETLLGWGCGPAAVATDTASVAPRSAPRATKDRVLERLDIDGFLSTRIRSLRCPAPHNRTHRDNGLPDPCDPGPTPGRPHGPRPL